jgi:hypothetical protein
MSKLDRHRASITDDRLGYEDPMLRKNPHENRAPLALRPVVIFGSLAVFVLALALSTTGCSCGSQPTLDSGVQGEVRIGPISPVEQPGVENSAPYVATLLVKKPSSDKTIAQTVSAADGTFRIFLPPGTYVLEPVNGDPLPVAAPQEFVVQPGRFTTVRVDYDSGIR